MNNDKQTDKYNNYFADDKYHENNYYKNKDSIDIGQEINQSNFSRMNKERKISLVVLGAFSLLVIIIFFINLNNSIKDPFVIKDPNRSNREDANLGSGSNSLSCTGPDCNSFESLTVDNLDLKLIDTDSDGISDWDELFIYGTSPYLEDTSGDGINDYDAIFRYKIDPLCPAGEVCSKTPVINTSQSSPEDFSPYLENLDGVDTNSLNNNSVLTPDDVISQMQNISASEIRELLLDSGLKKEDLDLISDEDLLELYMASLEEINFSQIQ